MISRRSWLVVGIVRSISSSCRVRASHYDVLGITAKATQSDIKAAYYELSKIYHPDKSSDEESAKKFRLISEAYEVLGNIRSKKMYDKGLLVGRGNSIQKGYQPEVEPTDPTLRFYSSRTRRSVIPTMDGKTPIYNFDDWSKNHYGTLFEKNQYDKEMTRQRKAKQQDSSTATKQESMLLFMVAIGSIFSILVLKGTTDYDKDRIKSNTKETDISSE